MDLAASSKIFKALSDTSRLLILNSLLNKVQYVEEIARRLNLSVSTVSFHLRKLEEANLVYKVKDQYYTILHLNNEIFGLSLKELISFAHEEHSSQEERLRRYSQKILGTYIKNGVLLKVPSQYKKRIIILEAILTLFEQGTVYSEKEVDQKINQVFGDHCAVRRHFIDENMMFRKKGKYTLNEKYKSDSLLPDNPLSVKDTEEQEKYNKENDKMIERIKIKKNYKLTLRPMGVYRLRDLGNNKTYVGMSKNLDAIFNRHLFELNTGMHQIKDLQATWDQLKEKGVMLEVLEYVKPVDDPLYNYTADLNTLLELWIEKLKSESGDFYILNGTMIKKRISGNSK